jgi:hypothetical protein
MGIKGPFTGDGNVEITICYAGHTFFAQHCLYILISPYFSGKTTQLISIKSIVYDTAELQPSCEYGSHHLFFAVLGYNDSGSVRKNGSAHYKLFCCEDASACKASADTRPSALNKLLMRVCSDKK